MTEESILVQADKLVSGERQWSYDHPYDNCTRIGQIWGVILNEGIPIAPEHVALCLAGLKIAREVHRHTDDNLIDLAGYAKVCHMVHTKKELLEKVHGKEANSEGDLEG
tara:strand:- start:719 stop:1045 length:327 start_codon:yes stop_codon:yes gene_type:complete